MKISIIIPTYNEEIELPKLLSFFKENLDYTIVQEVIVVDGKSKDKTVKIAQQFTVSVLQSPKKGRANQMNYGAATAKGTILYFLHVDTLPPKGFEKEILKAIKNKVDFGCFCMKFDSEHWFLSFFAWFTRFDNILCRGGDQSLFVKRNAFEYIGGFPKQQLMEDYDIIKKLKKKYRFFIIPNCVITSARKYKKNGFFRLQFLYGIIHLMDFFGVSLQKIENFYSKNIR